jgi:hypothetical protein
MGPSIPRCRGKRSPARGAPRAGDRFGAIRGFLPGTTDQEEVTTMSANFRKPSQRVQLVLVVLQVLLIVIESGAAIVKLLNEL